MTTGTTREYPKSGAATPSASAKGKSDEKEPLDTVAPPIATPQPEEEEAGKNDDKDDPEAEIDKVKAEIVVLVKQAQKTKGVKELQEIFKKIHKLNAKLTSKGYIYEKPPAVEEPEHPHAA